jgi:hypothetical protein
LRAKARQYSEFASKSEQKHVNTANLRAKASKSTSIQQKRAKASKSEQKPRAIKGAIACSPVAL